MSIWNFLAAFNANHESSRGKQSQSGGSLFGKISYTVAELDEDGFVVDVVHRGNEIVEQPAEHEGRYSNPFGNDGAAYLAKSMAQDYSNQLLRHEAFSCDYEAPQDNQGSVPVWDGYNGE